MKSSYQIKDLGLALKHFILNNTDITLTDVAENAIGIHKVSLYRRLNDNNIKIAEAQKIADYANIAVTVTVESMEISNVNQEATNYKELLKANSKIIELQEQIIELQDKLSACERKNAKV